MSQFLSNPTLKSFNLLKQILKYLYNTSNAKLKHKKYPDLDIGAYTDSSFATASGGRSYTGYNIFINDTAIIWSTSVQSVTAQSVNESELIACNSGARDLMFLVELIYEIFKIKKIPRIETDNEGVCSTTENGLTTKLTRYVNNRETYIKDLCDKEENFFRNKLKKSR